MTTLDLPAISHLSVEAKRKLLAVLARDLLANSCGSVSISEDEGSFLVISAVESSREIAEAMIRNRTPEEWEELERRVADPDNTFSVEEALRYPWNRGEASSRSPSRS
jgi:hypothetical protein